MDSRRLVVWITAGILGFQGGTLALDLLNCTLLSWVYVRRHGLELASPAPAAAQGPPGGVPEALASSGASAGGSLHGQPPGGSGDNQGQGAEGRDSAAVMATRPAQSATPGETSTTAPHLLSAQALFDPSGVLCDRPHSRIDAAVSQGLSILAGLALGGSGVGGGKGAP